MNALVQAVRDWRSENDLPLEHCEPAEMGFAGFINHIPGNDGYAAFARGDLQAAHAAWKPIQAQMAAQQHVLACVNFDPLWHASLQGHDGWPEVHGEAAAAGDTVLVACDGRYFDAFGAALIVSIRDASPGLQIHLHLMDPLPAQLDAARAMVPDGLSWEHPNGDRGYYHAARFVRFADLLRHYGSLLLLDADQLARRDLRALFPAEPLAMRFRPGRIEPWNQINASAVYGGRGAQEYFDKVAAYLTAYRKQLFWGIDQLALFAVWAMGTQPEAHAYTPVELDYEHTPDGVLWPNSGAGKFNDPGARPVFAAALAYHQARTPTPEGLGMAGCEMLTSGAPGEAAGLLVRSMHAVADRMDLPAVPEYRAGDRKAGPFVYLPVEVSARELNAKAWLAGEMARRGYQVLIGATWEMLAGRFADLPPGLVLFKTMNALDAVNAWHAQAAGHLTAALNEEFFGLAPERWVYETEIHARARENVDLVCAQGFAQAQAYAHMGLAARITGNPRAAVAAPAARNGREILIATMSGTVNNSLPFHRFMEAAFRAWGAAGVNERRLIAEQIEHECAMLPLMLSAIAEICASNPDRVVRVRPHPSENPALYASVVNACQNAILDDRTPFSERLKDAAIVVFVSGCATGAEAALAGAPGVRIGTGGHGISAELGAAYRPGLVREFIAGNVAAQPCDLSAHFAPVVLPDVLDEFRRERAMTLTVDLATVMACRDVEWKPGAFHEGKFADVDDERMAALCGVPVKRVGWRLWTCG